MKTETKLVIARAVVNVFLVAALAIIAVNVLLILI